MAWLFSDTSNACWICSVEISGQTSDLCRECQAKAAVNSARIHDMHEVLIHVRGWPGQPVTMDRWAQLVRRGKSDNPEATRRAWQRMKSWLKAHGAPVDFEPDEAGGVEPLRLRRGFDAWLARMEHEWVGWDLSSDEQNRLPWEAEKGEANE